MNVMFMSTDWSVFADEKGLITPGGSNHYRMALPARMLEAAGHRVLLGHKLWQDRSGEFILETPDGERHGGFDVVVIQRWMDVSAPACIARARAHGQRVVYDIDDWWDGIATSNGAFWGTHPKINPGSNRNHLRKALAAVDAVTVSTEFLAERMRRLNPNVAVLRNTIDLRDWTRSPALDRDQVIAGWVGHVGTRSSDLEILKGILGPWLDSVGGSFFHGGANSEEHSAGPRFGLDKTEVPSSWMPMQPIHLYPRFFRRFNLGLVPLSTIPFNEAKSEVKGLEYSAARLPFIASATPSYEYLSNEIGAGVLARKGKHWLNALERFREPEARREAGEHNRALVEQHYDVSGPARLPYLEFYGTLR